MFLEILSRVSQFFAEKVETRNILFHQIGKTNKVNCLTLYSANLFPDITINGKRFVRIWLEGFQLNI